GWGGWLLGGFMMLLFWGGVIALVFFGIRAFTGSANRNVTKQTDSGESALDILKKRYARGELSKEEYETIRSDLET
ncbi:MAG: SHOCT domain-containing protein, partial [Chloroflexota bacterium]